MCALFLRPIARPISHAPSILRPCARFISSNHQVFAENDIVLLRNTRDPEKFHLSKPLHAEGSWESHYGSVKHSEIIGKPVRHIISARNEKLRVTFPTLEEYIVNVRRKVTPIYPLDAATIVTLLDLHVMGPMAMPDSKPVEVFEAGTGHGSLTLALCRALYAGNSHLPVPLPDEQRVERGAVIHSIDKSKSHSDHAQKVVDGFRRGMYTGCVDFHVADPSEWLTQALEDRDGKAFLTAAILDLPETSEQVDAAASALLPDGILGVFCPSITQIGAVVEHMREAKTPLVMDRVVEFPGGSVGAGLRRWDVRFAQIRARADRALSMREAENRLDGVEDMDQINEAMNKRYEMVCRPLSGERTRGGGFFATFRRKQDSYKQQVENMKAELEST